MQLIDCLIKLHKRFFIKAGLLWYDSRISKRLYFIILDILHILDPRRLKGVYFYELSKVW